jgi:hypothetical protein
MKGVFTRILIAALASVITSFAKVPTQDQYQQADAQLNQVYQQFNGTLNDTQKE